jgi:Flp pilus assembly protein TadD
VAVAVLALSVAGARADEPCGTEGAREHFQRAVALYDAGQYAGALLEFREAYRCRPAPPLRWNIAVCLVRLGRVDEARGELQAYLRDTADPPGSPVTSLQVDEAMERIANDIAAGR